MGKRKTATHSSAAAAAGVSPLTCRCWVPPYLCATPTRVRRLRHVPLAAAAVAIWLTDRGCRAQISAFAYELLNPLVHLGYVTKSMVTQACSGLSVVADLAQCANADMVIEAVRAPPGRTRQHTAERCRR
jgi:hypothetical protein